VADDRLIDTSDSELERQMLRAAADEKVPADVRRRALASLGLLAIAPLGTVSTAAAGTEGATAAVKALGWQASLAKAGAIVGIGGTVLGVGATVEWSRASLEAQVGDTAPVSRPAAPEHASKAPTTARPSETTLSIVSRARTPWPLPTHDSSARPRAADGDRARAAPARAAAGSRTAPEAPLARVADAPLQPAATSIREEIDLLDRARAQLSRGNPGAASEIIGHYFARYPNGELRAEAELVRREARLAEE
jgi:hypothetical protein